MSNSMRPDVKRILRACVVQRELGIDLVPGLELLLLCAEIMSARDAMYEARSHLGAIMIQTQPQDDPIIIGHVADALRILSATMNPICKQCGQREVEDARVCYATPVCFACSQSRVR